ncbi:MAG: arsenate reductase (glutaredoxin) [Flavobacteriaceae bacterium]|nr:arsenate reductase (glutaredoxin) [Flavobacteriaceae bacterium]
MIQIYHNPRCSKSREALDLLRNKNVDFEEIHYLKVGLSLEELKNILQKLDMKPMHLVRSKEKIWQEEFAGKNLSEDEIINAMILYPQLMERPVVIHNQKAVIARPAEKMDEIL